MDHPDPEQTEFDDAGYEIVTVTVLDYINTLLQDRDLDVRRVAAEALTRLWNNSTRRCCRTLLAHSVGVGGNCRTRRDFDGGTHGESKKKLAEADQQAEECASRRAICWQVGGADDAGLFVFTIVTWVSDDILPAVLLLCVRMGVFGSAAECSASVCHGFLGGCTVKDATDPIPAFDALSHDDLYRVRKSTGECLVDI
jgi:hypothetical protein